jgi:hypothetical protein
LAVEIVSRSDGDTESWSERLAKYHRLGITELVRFEADERTAPLRVWDYVEGDLVERVVVPGTCTECASLGLYWVALEDAELGLLLRLARDAAGLDLLPIEEAEAKLEASEAARRVSEAARRASEAARRASEAERDAALQRICDLEQELLKKR